MVDYPIGFNEESELILNLSDLQPLPVVERYDEGYLVTNALTKTGTFTFWLAQFGVNFNMKRLG